MKKKLMINPTEVEINLEDFSHLCRLDQLKLKVVDAKNNLKYWEDLVTHEVILIAGNHYNEHNSK